MAAALDAYFDKISKLRMAYRVLIFVGTVVLLLGLFIWIIYIPKTGEIDEIKSDLDRLEREIRVAMAAVQRTPYRNSEVEELLSYKEIDINLIEKAKAGLAASIAPRESSLRAKPAYKKAMVGTLMEKILKSLKVL